MKIKIITTGGINVDAEVESIEKFCETIKGVEWLRVGDGVVRTSQILAVLPVIEQPTIAELTDEQA